MTSIQQATEHLNSNLNQLNQLSESQQAAAMSPAKDVNDFRYHRLERENQSQFTNLQVNILYMVHNTYAFVLNSSGTYVLNLNFCLLK